MAKAPQPPSESETTETEVETAQAPPTAKTETPPPSKTEDEKPSLLARIGAGAVTALHVAALVGGVLGGVHTLNSWRLGRRERKMEAAAIAAAAVNTDFTEALPV